MHSDGSGGDLLAIQAGGSRHPASESTLHDGRHLITMDGNEVFRFATRVMASATLEALDAAKLKLEDIQWIIPHQANIRIIQAAARGLKLPMDRFVVNLENYGNTSTASIPIAMVELLKGKAQDRHKLVMVGFGAGLTWRVGRRGTGPFQAKAMFILNSTPSSPSYALCSRGIRVIEAGCIDVTLVPKPRNSRRTCILSA